MKIGSIIKKLRIQNGLTQEQLSIETFELSSIEEAEMLVEKFSIENFPVLENHSITEKDGTVILEVEKKFDVNLEDMPFKQYNQG